MKRLIKKVGVFRLLYTPMGIWILIMAWQSHLWLMGFIGAVVLVFGLMNRCVMSGKCETDF